MLLPPLRTKTIIPPCRAKQITRASLLERLAEGMHRALTLIIAPAGYGKTTLIAAWAQSAGLPVAWLTLQPTDRVRERFLAYLIQALQAISPQIGQTTLAMLQGGSPDGALYALANDLAEVESRMALVLDDYHCVDDPAIGEVLQFLLEHRPPTFHVALTARAMPSLSLARLRAVDQVTEITASDLRFSEAEMREFFAYCLGINLTAGEIARLNQSTEGWAAGLQLVGVALAREPADRRLPMERTRVFDYLAEEVFRRERPEVQAFLIRTALFDRFCIPLCEQLLGGSLDLSEPSASSLLAEVERSNLFLVPLDTAGIWHRYHALFAEFLRRQCPPDLAAQLHRTASRWFEENGLLDDAINSALHAADFEHATGLLEDHYRDMVQRGEQAALKEWLSALPPELLEQRPRLWLARGWASIIALDSTQAEASAEKVVSLAPAGNNGNALRGEAQAMRILAGIFAGRVATADEIAVASGLLSEHDEFLHSLLHFNLGLHYVMQGETAQAVEAFSETLRLAQALKNPLVTIVAGVQLGETRQCRGALGLAERAFRQTVRYAQETLGEHTFLLGMPYISYADLLREQNRCDEARRYAERGITYCQIWQPVASMDGQIVLARLAAAQRRWDEAFSHLEGAMRLAEGSISVLDDTFLAVHLVRLALLKGDRSRAQHWLEMYDLKSAAQGAYYHFREMMQLVVLRAQVLALDTDPSPAAAVAEALTMLIAESDRRERVSPAIEALLLRSYALHAAGHQADAVESLSRALTLGAQSGYVRLFADEGQRLLYLLAENNAQLRAPRHYCDDLLALLRQGAAHSPAAARHDHPPLSDLSPLTRREQDILELMAAGKSNQEIAAERVVTLNTVKKHVANILSKLGVANRTQAVMLARRLGWLK